MNKSDSKSNTSESAENNAESSVVTPLHGRDSQTTSLEADLLLVKEQLRQIEEQLENLSEVNASKVVDLHNRIEAGEYEINPERIARKLLDLESELNRR